MQTATITRQSTINNRSRLAPYIEAAFQLPEPRTVRLLPAPDVGTRNLPLIERAEPHPKPVPRAIGEFYLGQDFYTREETQQILGVQSRRESQIMANTAGHLIKWDRSGRGRPAKLYHFTSHPALTAHHYEEKLGDGTLANNKSKVKTIDPADLETARLRAQACEEYQARCNCMKESEAAAFTCAEWSRHPHEATVKVTKRLKKTRGQTKAIKTTISVGGFSERTLRGWNSKYKSNILNLVPQRKGQSGARRIDIPERIINLVYFYATKGPRANLSAAIARVRAMNLDDFPNCSDSTLDRRIRELDPQRFMRTLGKKGIASFQLEHVPDIEIDRSQMALNELWEIDDVEMDFYCHSAVNPEKVVRLHGYAIIRVATREILNMVISEVDITKKQVRELVGLSLVSKRCGIPKKIKFERGTLACDADLQSRLEKCGTQVGRTSMDGGQIHPGAIEDRAKGHFNGKAIIERFFRTLHNLLWDTLGQTGPNERETAHANLEKVKAESIRRIKANEPPLLPTLEQGRSLVIRALEIYNNNPHTSLPKNHHGKGHMSPNTYARSIDEPVKVLDGLLLPMFIMDAFNVEVTKNGCRINKQSYGRYDDELKTLATATLHISDDHPDIAYCLELGRCIERYEPTTYEASSKQYGQMKHQSKRFKNQFEEMVASANNTIVEVINTTTDPTPDRTVETVAPKSLVNRLTMVDQGITEHRAVETKNAKRFELERKPKQSPASTGRGILAKSKSLRSQVDMLSGAAESDDDLFEI